MPSKTRRRKSLTSDTRIASLETKFNELSKTVYDLTTELAGLTKDIADNGPTSINSKGRLSSNN